MAWSVRWSSSCPDLGSPPPDDPKLLGWCDMPAAGALALLAAVTPTSVGGYRQTLTGGMNPLALGTSAESPGRAHGLTPFWAPSGYHRRMAIGTAHARPPWRWSPDRLPASTARKDLPVSGSRAARWRSSAAARIFRRRTRSRCSRVIGPSDRYGRVEWRCR